MSVGFSGWGGVVLEVNLAGPGTGTGESPKCQSRARPTSRLAGQGNRRRGSSLVWEAEGRRR